MIAMQQSSKVTSVGPHLGTLCEQPPTLREGQRWDALQLSFRGTWKQHHSVLYFQYLPSSVGKEQILCPAVEKKRRISHLFLHWTWARFGSSRKVSIVLKSQATLILSGVGNLWPFRYFGQPCPHLVSLGYTSCPLGGIQNIWRTNCSLILPQISFLWKGLGP